MKRPLTLAAALTAGLAAAPAGAQSLRIAHGYPAQSIIGATYDHFAEYVEANSEIEAEVFALTLLDLRQASPGLTSGVADVSMVLTPYFQNEFSEANFPADLSMAANIDGQPTSIAAAICSRKTRRSAPTGTAMSRVMHVPLRRRTVYVSRGSGPSSSGEAA